MEETILSGLKVYSPSESALFIRHDGKIETIEHVVDVAEIAEGRLQIAYENGESEIRDGLIFGATGIWKIWLFNDGDDGIEKYESNYPITLPNDNIGMNGARTQRPGCIKRLKRIE